ncbi:SEC-C metal-binding domain-containing protein [Pseudomonas thivervalensis]|uniref:SEC-C metal-binding domain-containing protein n=1 Tax=Pseudomonas thivervalensis TaxID=86265 RepID=UPI00087A5724|nr:SEC-C metal-binding domain-containing protein [Pseudomonas thivervalensis]SDG10374.1 SEC-C motif-containing protein [Pseudomonas thivervalensis]
MAVAKRNKQGLGRYIPADVRRQVRQRDGFGCIICGSAFYQYDHLGVEFVDADLHEPEKIVLLCGSCHDRKTRGALSTETIARHAEAPKCREKEFSWGAFDVGVTTPEVVLGSITAKSAMTLISVDGEEVFSISPPEGENQPFRVNARFYDKSGELTLEVIDNEMRAAVTNWDIEVVGNRIEIRSQLGVFDLVIRSEPPHRLVIERLDMVYKGLSIICREGVDTTIENDGAILRVQGGVFDCDGIIELDNGVLSVGRMCRFVTMDFLHVGSGSSRSSPTLRPSISSSTHVRNLLNQGRNEPCNCGSGIKFKYCHGAVP